MKKQLRKYLKENACVLLSIILNKRYESEYNTNLASGQDKNQFAFYNKNSKDSEVFC